MEFGEKFPVIGEEQILQPCVEKYKKVVQISLLANI